MLSKNTVSVMRGAALWAVTFASVVTVATIWSAAYVSFTTTDYAYPRTGGATNLNATMWNKVIDNVANLDSRLSNVSFSWWSVGVGGITSSARFYVADSMRVGSSTGTSSLQVDRPAWQFGLLQFRTAWTNRWSFYATDTAESGSNSWSDLALLSYTDAGAPLRTDMHILRSNGNVGFGVTNPSARFNVSSDSTKKALFDGNEFFQFHGGHSSYGTFSSDNTTLGIGTYDISGDSVFTSPMEGAFLGTLNSVPLNFRIANIERVRIDTNGNVGIWTSAPGYKLDVNGTVNATTSCLGWSCLSAWGGIVGGSYTTATTGCPAVNNPVTGSTSCASGFTAVVTGRGLCEPSDATVSVTYLCVKN